MLVVIPVQSVGYLLSKVLIVSPVQGADSTSCQRCWLPPVKGVGSTSCQGVGGVSCAGISECERSGADVGGPCLRWRGRNNRNETLKLTRAVSLPHTTLQTSQCLPVNMMMKGFLVLLCFHLGYSLEISLGRDSNVYPLFLNPFDVTHWKCLGYTV